MPELKDPKREAFAQAYVLGPTAGDGPASYLAAGFKGAATLACSRAWGLLKDAAVVRRIGELQAETHGIATMASEQAIQRLGISKHAVLVELAKIAFANMLDYVAPGKAGAPAFNFSRIERDKGAAIQELIIDERWNGDGVQVGRRVRLKLADKRAALVDLGKHLGLCVERHHVTHDDAEMSDEQIDQQIRQAADQLARMGIDVQALVGIGAVDDAQDASLRAHESAQISAVPEAGDVPRSRTGSQ